MNINFKVLSYLLPSFLNFFFFFNTACPYCLHFVKFLTLFWLYWIWLLSLPFSRNPLDRVSNSLLIASIHPKWCLLWWLEFLPSLLPAFWMSRKESLFASIFMSFFAYPLNATALRALSSLLFISSTPMASVCHLSDNDKLESLAQTFLLSPWSTFPLLAEILQAKKYIFIFL